MVRKTRLKTLVSGALLGAVSLPLSGLIGASPASAQTAVPIPAVPPLAPATATPPVVPVSPVAAVTSAPAPSVVVRPGDTLAGIATELGVTWPLLAAWNHIPNPNLIFPGQRVVAPPAGWTPTATPAAATVEAAAVPEAPAAPAAPVVAVTPRRPAVSVVHFTSPARPLARPVQVFHPAAASSRPAAAVVPAGGFQACVISRESGGNANARNGQYWGLYQFSPSTWAAYGGSSGAFGSASGAAQTAVFNRAIAAGGQSNWSPYDHC